MKLFFQTTYSDFVGCFSTADDLPNWSYLIYAASDADEATCIQSCTADTTCDFIGTGAGEDGDACYLGDFVTEIAIPDPPNVLDPKISFSDGNQPISCSSRKI